MKFVVAVALIAAVAFAEEIAVSSKLIREVNAKQTMWKAAHNPITRMPKSEARRLLGVDLKNLRSYNWRKQEFTAAEIAAAPASFDSRTQWPSCSTMNDIRNQKHCGSCWAFGAVESMSDRECVHKNEIVRLSAEDMNSCSMSLITHCGSCNGGQPACAWSYWVKTGVVSEDCYPYSAGNDPSSMVTPECKKKCTGNTALSWDSDKRKGEKSYTIIGEENMKTEVSTNGPFEVAFEVYEDFMSYSSGIYHHTSGGFEGGHAVKLMGYGEEGGVKYWLCANSWDTTWGEKGYFRIQRGNNECGIEEQAWAGIPL
jgi:Cysteine protease